MAARLDAPLPVRWACLVHDLGKGTTPPRPVAAPLGHEERSVKLARALGERLRVPTDCRELADVVAREHGHVHRSANARRRGPAAPARALRRAAPARTASPQCCWPANVTRAAAPGREHAAYAPRAAPAAGAAGGPGRGHGAHRRRRAGTRPRRPGHRPRDPRRARSRDRCSDHGDRRLTDAQISAPMTIASRLSTRLLASGT